MSGKSTNGNGGTMVAIQAPEELRKAIEQLRLAMPYLLEMYSITAVAHKAKFDEFVKVGFTENQALELCKTLV